MMSNDVLSLARCLGETIDMWMLRTIRPIYARLMNEISATKIDQGSTTTMGTSECFKKYITLGRGFPRLNHIRGINGRQRKSSGSLRIELLYRVY